MILCCRKIVVKCAYLRFLMYIQSKFQTKTKSIYLSNISSVIGARTNVPTPLPHKQIAKKKENQ